MHIAGAMMKVEDLVGLGDGGKQRIVASQAFLFLVEAHRSAFGMAFRAQHRAVEIQGDSGSVVLCQAVEDEGAVDAA